MKYDVTVCGPGGHDIVTVEAESGDEAAKKAYKPGTVIRGIEPAAAVEKPAKAAKSE